MAYGRKRSAYRKRRNVIPRKTQKVRRLAGMEGQTMVERIAGGVGQVAKVARQVSMLSGLINSEVKYLDTAVNGAIAATGATGISTITQIAEGDDVSQRNGRWVLAKSLQARLSFNVNTAATGSTVVGYAFVMDKKASIGLSGTPWTDVFSTADADALINRGDSERFVILKRGVLDLSLQNASKHTKLYFPLKGIHLKYNGTLGTNVDQNMIYLLLITNQGTNQPTCVGNIRFDFYDN